MEGFGHYINAAKSMGALVITTDAEPMNCLISNEFGRLVPVSSTEKYALVEKSILRREDLEKAVDYVLSLDYQQRQILGEMARSSYLNEKKKFHSAMAVALENACD
jgi:hypothetical protein